MFSRLHYKTANGKWLKTSHLLAAIALLSGQASQASASTLEEVIVKAQKREQSLQDVPISITAMGKEELKIKGIANIEDIGTYAPNVKITRTATSTTGATIAIRGSVTSNPAITWEPTVGIYLDGVYVGKNLGSVFDIAELASIEVLRGPQGTLYGKNTLGGAVNLITERPTKEAGMNLKAKLGNYKLRSTSLSLNSGEADIGSMGTFRAKLTLALKKRDGLYKIRASDIESRGPDGNPLMPNPPKSKEHNSLDSRQGRLDLLWQPTDVLEARLVADRVKQDNTPSKGVLTHLAPDEGPFAGILPEGLDNYLYRKNRNHRHAINDGGDFEKSRNTSYSLFVDYHLDFLGEATAKYIGNYRDLDWRDWADYDGSPFAITQGGRVINYDQTSHELQLVGNSNRVDYVAGLYWFKEKASNASTFHSLSYLDLPATFRKYGLESKSYAAFTQLDWRPEAQVLQDRLMVSAGLRWTREKKDSYVLDPDPAAGKASKKFHNVSPSLTLKWDLLEDTNIYVKYSEGWIAGGFNGESGSREGFQGGYDESSVSSYEAGLKSIWLDNRLRASGAFFHNKIKDMQLNVFTGGSLASTEVRNAGVAVIQGFEIDMTYQPLSSLTLSASYGYLDAKYRKYKDFDSSGVLRNLKNEKDFPYAPRHSYNLSMDYILSRTSWSEIIAHLDYSYVDDHVPYVDPQENSTSKINSFGILNGRIAMRDIKLAQGHLELALWAKNIRNKEYRVNTIPFTSYTTSYFGDPRTFGVELSYQY